MMEQNELAGAGSKPPESEPKLRLRILYAPHGSVEDFKLLEGKLREADIYFPENAGWNTDTEAAYQAYATGKYSTKELAVEPALKRELGILEELGKSGKTLAVGFVDLPEGHPLVEPLYKLSSEKAILEFERGNFSEALKEIKKMARDNAQLTEQRDKYIQAQIGPKVKEMLVQYPELEEKLDKGDELNVLLSLGPTHTRVFHLLKKAGEKVKREFTDSQYLFGPLQELVRRYLFGREVNDELAARALLFSKLLPDVALCNDTDKIYRVASKIVTNLELKDIEKISSEFGSGRSLDRILKSFGIQIPQSEAEMDEIISS